MSSQSQILANQSNAQKSTGPTSPDGKKHSSLNAMRHGLTAQTVVLPHEDMEAYCALQQSFIDRFQPADALENEFVSRLAANQWRLNRCESLEHGLFMLGQIEAPAENGAPDSGMHAVLASARVLRDQTGALKTLTMHEQRIHRMFLRDLDALKAMQAERKAAGLVQMNEAALIRKHNQTLDEAWEPSQDGFVFSLAEIDRHIAREKQRNAAAHTHIHALRQAAIAPRAPAA